MAIGNASSFVASLRANEILQTFYFIGRYSLLAALIGMWVV